MELATKVRGKLGAYVVRNDIPEVAGVTWEPVAGDEDKGHYDIFGNVDMLKRYVAVDYCIDVGLGRR